MRIKYKENKGITMVALIVTIIILLILAGVSITLLFGSNGVIARAISAVREHKRAEYFEIINLEILDEQTERFEQVKEEVFIKSIKNRIEKLTWVKGVLICKEVEGNLESETTEEDANVLIVETKDGYELIIDVNNIELTANIRDYFEKIDNNNKYIVTYDKNGGVGEEIEKQEIRKGFGIRVKENRYTRENYKFVGWSENKEGKGERYQVGSIYIPNKDTKLYAIWDKNVSKIRFNNNGGGGIMQEITVSKGEITKLPENEFIKEGYNFIKWNTKADGTGEDYKEGESIEVDEDVELYAMWEEKISATLSINAKKLTEGTKINIGVSAKVAKIKKIELKIGDIEVYIDTIDNQGTYNKALDIITLKEINKLEFYKDYKMKLKVTTENNKIDEKEVIGIKNYTIGTAENLNKFATLVNGNNIFTGETIYQLNDIDLSSICSKTKGSWIMIGNSNYQFNGTYNGNNKTINNIYINEPSYIAGLFSYLNSNGIIKGLTTNGEATNTTSEYACGGIVGRNEGIIQDCINNVNVTSFSRAGGIVGNNQNKVINCTNNGTIKSTSLAGGITGINRLGSIQNCKNVGIVSSEGIIDDMIIGTGGIVGKSTGGEIKYSSNVGKITSRASRFVGGIIGYAESGVSISECYNYNGIIEGEANGVGGIIGGSFGSTISNCYNYLSSSNYYIKSKKSNVGGIVGVNNELSTQKTIIQNCYSIGENITGTSRCRYYCWIYRL